MARRAPAGYDRIPQPVEAVTKPRPEERQNMKRAFLSFIAIPLVGLVPFAVVAQDKTADMKMSVVPQTPEWQKLKSLVGEWDGVVDEGGKRVATTVEVRMTGDGSAIMHVMARDTPHEMVTMFHPDGKRLLATHYCAAHNQPRMVLVPAAKPNQVAFDFLDGTNIAPGDGHMRSLVITFVDADHHEEAWTDSSSSQPAVFKYTRRRK
jgi:hypothetical protein